MREFLKALALLCGGKTIERHALRAALACATVHLQAFVAPVRLLCPHLGGACTEQVLQYPRQLGAGIKRSFP